MDTNDGQSWAQLKINSRPSIFLFHEKMCQRSNEKIYNRYRYTLAISLERHAKCSLCRIPHRENVQAGAEEQIVLKCFPWVKIYRSNRHTIQQRSETFYYWNYKVHEWIANGWSFPLDNFFYTHFVPLIIIYEDNFCIPDWVMRLPELSQKQTRSQKFIFWRNKRCIFKFVRTLMRSIDKIETFTRMIIVVEKLENAVNHRIRR